MHFVFELAVHMRKANAITRDNDVHHSRIAMDLESTVIPDHGAAVTDDVYRLLAGRKRYPTVADRGLAVVSKHEAVLARGPGRARVDIDQDPGEERNRGAYIARRGRRSQAGVLGAR